MIPVKVLGLWRASWNCLSIDMVYGWGTAGVRLGYGWGTDGIRIVYVWCTPRRDRVVFQGGGG